MAVGEGGGGGEAMEFLSSIEHCPTGDTDRVTRRNAAATGWLYLAYGSLRINYLAYGLISTWSCCIIFLEAKCSLCR